MLLNHIVALPISVIRVIATLLIFGLSYAFDFRWTESDFIRESTRNGLGARYTM